MYPKTVLSCLLLTTVCIALVPGCKKEDGSVAPVNTATPLTEQEILDKILSLPSAPFNYANPELPPYAATAGMQQLDNAPSNNPVTNDGATLGRVLFYDKSLSVNKTTSCGSCHKQANSFSEPVKFSKGFAGGLTARNSMTLVNARYYESGKFFWDERAASLEDQVLHPIQDPVEMGFDLDEMEKRLRDQEHYKILFKRAFGDANITREKVSLALAQFVRSMVSFHSKWDEGMLGPQNQAGGFVNFTAQENSGKQLFQNFCGRCHGTPAHIASQPRNTGLDLVYADNGLGAVTHNTADDGKFKTPSLRNIAVTAPYMHDGRFATLEAVVKFYNEEVKNHPNLDPSMKTLPPNSEPKRLNLTQEQQEALVVFLHTFTDDQFLTDVKFSDPFKR